MNGEEPFEVLTEREHEILVCLAERLTNQEIADRLYLSVKTVKWYNTQIFEREISQKGALRLPPDTILFHIRRLNHMSFSCVACGQCSEVCPADIPVSTIFKKTGEHTAKIFDYVPGIDLKEPVPVSVFKEDELKELGED